MHIFTKIIMLLGLTFVISCSASYKQLSNLPLTPTNKLSEFLMNSYKEKADFEAKKMHDWNSAKLYSEKAIAAAHGLKVMPQEINYWNIPIEKSYNLIKAHNNLNYIYQDGLSLNPLNLAIAITSLDCWAEQEEEGWQTWDINRCREDFLRSMHEIYLSIDTAEKKNTKTFKKIPKDSSVIITKDKKENILQIVYFDFDKSKLSSINKSEIKDFILTNKKIINKYLIKGHTDNVGTETYNQELSIMRAKTVKKILINLGIESSNIKILGMGETELSIKTNNETAHPVNRRAEISPLN